jgi:hypothetical protein
VHGHSGIEVENQRAADLVENSPKKLAADKIANRLAMPALD